MAYPGAISFSSIWLRGSVIFNSTLSFISLHLTLEISSLWRPSHLLPDSSDDISSWLFVMIDKNLNLKPEKIPHYCIKVYNNC